MKAVFWHSIHAREKALAAAVAKGAERSGDQIDCRLAPPEPELCDCDLACLVGVKTRDWFKLYRDAGIPVALFDKGYVRTLSQSRFWRVSLNGVQPLDYVRQAQHSPERWTELGVKVSGWKPRGSAVLIAGSSAKAMRWGGVMDATAWVRDLVRHIRHLTDRPIIYRPKASWRDAEPIEGTEFNQERHELRDCMRRSAVMVVSSSNACFDAVLAGLPVIVLGEGIARPIASTSIDDLAAPRLADRRERMQWLANLAHCQFTLKEYAAGTGWRQIRTMAEAA